MKNIKFLALTLSVVGAIAIGSFMSMGSSPDGIDGNTTLNTAEVSQKSTLSSTLSKITSIRQKAEQIPVFEIENNPLIEKHGGETFKKYLEDVASFHVKADAPNSQIVKEVSLTQFDKANYFMSLAAFAEGFSKTAYPDNKGIATGFGYNISMQKKELNKNMFSAIKMEEAVPVAQKLSGVMNYGNVAKEDLQKVSLDPRRAVQTTMIMSKEFSSEVPTVMANHLNKHTKAKIEMKKRGINSEDFAKEILSSLQPNERDVLTYHFYKVGAGGANKYNILFSSLIDYHFNKTDDNKKKVASSFTYKYSLDGEIKEDIRASGLIKLMFSEPDMFKDVVANAGVYPDKAKKFIQSVSPEVNFNPDGTIDSKGFEEASKKATSRFIITKSERMSMAAVINRF